MGVCVEGIVVWKKPTQHCKEIILQLKKTVYCSFVIEGQGGNGVIRRNSFLKKNEGRRLQKSSVRDAIVQIVTEERNYIIDQDQGIKNF